MYARKKVVELKVTVDEDFRQRLSGPGRNPEQRAAMPKDLHLIEAALQADRIVVSLDENAHMLFQVQELNSIIWVNPVSEQPRMQSWLEQGAPPVDEWKLGYHA
ncbi:MAG TPA: hypothetical protein VNV82_23325 [Bryobacteraceae bacterium]|jgi:hypothetical protein|nr:hypothetical protein [Bryobacteraceae bacterium]